jgi:hypothetical protein
MQFLKTSIFFLTVALFVACAKVPSDFEGIDGPVVLSLDPNISVEKWEYLSPEQLPQTDPLFCMAMMVLCLERNHTRQ